ncbi:phage conserved hypothetical protein TIGR01671 [Prevotella sp. oral taxon 472 str. F0295]|nr:YopX family protein [Prevotella sp. oral taxon 472]EEX52053.1 phage conserved hypothetical protein TIGR01671 [Prevotella sp. oral taxon 472 str. F0295]
MNREIIFRGKSLNSKCWVYGDLRQDHIRKKTYIEYEVSPDTIGQYTGMKDANGKEIYEGDIIESCGFRHIVGYDAKQARFSAKNINGPRDDGSSITQQWIDECEKVVIGNIYDNPELIKQ